MCWRCDMADAVTRATSDAGTRAALDRGQDLIGRYMAEHGCSFPAALQGLAAERQREYADLRATYAERHGLDDEQTLFALWAHGIDGPGSMQ
jgi:hypothetical protein